MLVRARNWCLCVVVFTLTLLFVSTEAAYGQGQAITASFSGTVTDPTGQGVSGAKVTLTSFDRGIVRSYSTEDNGSFSFSQLPAAAYKLEIESPGFKHYAQDGITLAAGQAADQKVTLTIGAVTENIEVTSEAPLLNSENANIASDISARQVAESPIEPAKRYRLSGAELFGQQRGGIADCRRARHFRQRGSGRFVP